MEPRSDIELQGTLTLAELARFQYFHTFRRIWPILVFGGMTALLIGIFLAVLAIVNPDSRVVFVNAMPFLLFPLLWIAVLGAIPYRSARKAFAAQRYFREPISYVFTPETVESKGTGVSSSISWNVLKHVRETNSLFLLYHVKDSAFILPKRFFRSPAEMENWRQLVRACSPRLIEKPGVVSRWC